jgi:hypothetical protein
MASASPVELSQPFGSAHLPFLTHQPLPQADQEVSLDASGDDEDKGAGSAGPRPEAGGQELNLSVYSAAAGPFEALLACIGQAPGARYLFYHAVTVDIQLAENK